MNFKRLMIVLGGVCLVAVLVFSWGCQNQPTGPEMGAGSFPPSSFKGRSSQTGTNGGYYYSLWDDDQGSVSWTLGSGGNYSVTWSNVNNFVGGKGWNPGSSSRSISYSANYNPNGNSYLTVYGWTRNALIEYYVVESWGSWKPPGGSGSQGSATIDGATYDLYRTTRNNQPSIDGTATFDQFWSVRSSKKGTGNVSGTVNFGNHVSAWRNKGMNLGSDHYYQLFATEGYQSSGNANVTVGGGGGGGSTTTSGGGGGSTTTSGGGGGSGTVEVCFDNDDYNGRDLYIESVTVGGNSRGSATLYSNGCSSFGSSGGTIVIRARGKAGSEHMVLKIGGSTVADWTVSTSARDYTYGSGGGSTTTTAASTTTTTSGGYTSTTTSGGGGGSNTIVVRARGTGGGEHITVSVGGSQIGSFNLTTSYANYTASTNNTGDIQVCFDNDDGENMDVQIDYIEVNGSRRQAEDQSSNTGVWQDSSCGGSYSEMLHCEGCIGFGSVSGGGGGATTTTSGGYTTTTASATTTTASSWWGGGSWYGSTTTSGGYTTTTAAATTTTSSSSWWGGGSWW